MITTETAKVYRANGRRYFTRRAAFHALFRAAVKRHCDCEPFEDATGYPGNTCRYHGDQALYGQLMARYVRLLKRRAT